MASAVNLIALRATEIQQLILDSTQELRKKCFDEVLNIFSNTC